jgi:hypothetical protein
MGGLPPFIFSYLTPHYFPSAKQMLNRNKNDLFGKMTAGGRYDREITNGAKRIANGKSNGNGKARRANHEPVKPAKLV